MSVDMDKISELLKQKLDEALEPKNGQVLASQPFKSQDQLQKETYEKLIVKSNKPIDTAKQLEPFSTYTFLDDLFLNQRDKSLCGLPICGQFGVLGMPDAGKSILMEEIAIKVAQVGRKVLYITSEDIFHSETLRLDLESRMIQKSKLLELNWEEIKSNLFVMDTITHSELGDWETFANTYKYACETYKIELVIVDSVTILDSYRGALKYRIMELIKYNQLHGITGLFVNQRSQDTPDSYKLAGGIALAHNLDGTIIIDFMQYWDNMAIKRDYMRVCDEGPERKQVLRFARVLGCRMSNFDRSYNFLTITSNGFLKLIKRKGE